MSSAALRRSVVFFLACGVLAWFPTPAVASPAVGHIDGTVQDSASGAPLGLARVEAVTASSSAKSTTDSLGRFSLAVTTGRYSIVVTLAEYKTSQPISVDVEEDQTAEVTVRLVRNIRTLATVDVAGRRGDLIGVATTAAEGVVGAKELSERPILRPGEVLETIPGVVISQHSGGGKANQYYLRGFNLDHGTDLASSIVGIPINMPTHAHGQGYSDINWLIPELVAGVQYKKGPYYADEGDFSTAGVVNISYATQIPDLLSMGLGQNGYDRFLVAGARGVGNGHLLYAYEQYHEDGPWILPDNYRRSNAVLRFSRQSATSLWSLTGMAYQGEFHSSDQIPTRAVLDGQISRFGYIEPNDGGRTYRYALSSESTHIGEHATSSFTAYALAYKLNLFSNFTYFLERPTTGDQFEQADKRVVEGFKLSRDVQSRIGRYAAVNTIGVEARNDNIVTDGLFHTEAQIPFETVSLDKVDE